ncbi:MAG: MoaD/ThiS family protein [Myxococcales bacterium]|nr:MoaD/ThiS family protein [Myxococcales bacterium]MDH5567675.1 MoaD/ThiS family protein [Myxococcales bacterium]
MKIGFYATLRPLVGAKTVEVALPQDATVRELLDHLIERWPALRGALLDADGALSGRVHVFVNGRSARFLDGAQTRLAPDAEIDIIPAVAGG